MVGDEQERALLVRRAYVLESKVLYEIARNEADSECPEVALAKGPECLDGLPVHAQGNIHVQPFQWGQALRHVGWQPLVDQHGLSLFVVSHVVVDSDEPQLHSTGTWPIWPVTRS